MRKFINIISEAPIIDYSYDDIEKSSFSSQDQSLIKSERHKEKIIDAFSKVPYKFKIRFEGSDDFRYDARNVPEILNKISGGAHEESTKRYITVILRGNVDSQNRIPITPWILAHKIGHAIADTKFSLSRAGNHIENVYKYVKMIKKTVKGPLSSIMTMKSARTGQLKESSEHVPEMIAQFLINGRVTFKDENPGLVKRTAQFIKLLYARNHIEDLLNKELHLLFNALEKNGHIMVEI